MDNFVFFIVLFALIAISVIAISQHAEKRRREQLQCMAASTGLSFSPDVDGHLLDTLRPFHLFSQGHSRRIYNVLQGSVDDARVTLFDYKYSTSSGKHHHTRRQTVLLLESDRLRLPFFTLRPEHFLHRMAGAFGYEDIDFASHPTFSDSYLLKGEDEGQIRATFTEQVLSFYSRHANLSTEGADRQLLFYRAGARLDAGALEGFLHEGLAVLDLFLEKEKVDWEELLAPLELPA